MVFVPEVHDQRAECGFMLWKQASIAHQDASEQHFGGNRVVTRGRSTPTPQDIDGLKLVQLVLQVEESLRCEDVRHASCHLLQRAPEFADGKFLVVSPVKKEQSAQDVRQGETAQSVEQPQLDRDGESNRTRHEYLRCPCP